MRKIREVLRLKLECGLSHRQVSRSCRLAHGTVGEYVLRASAAGLDWEKVQGLDDEALERLLFPGQVKGAVVERPLPEWAAIHRELRRKGVTLALLWQEYRQGEPSGLQYSRGCELYQAWRKGLSLSMRQVHRAGEKMFVDYCGPTVGVVDRATGEVREASIFVAVLGASSYTYAEATFGQGLESWIGSHVRAFEFFNGSSELVVPDNLRSGVTRACRYDPDVNATYHKLAEHYGVAVVPARPYKPRDKAKAEAGVLVVERWVLARLRNRIFFNLAELNAEIARLVAKLNERVMRVVGVSRRELYETVDRPALRPLPAERFELCEWRRARVHIDYHVLVADHYYSVPYQLVSREVEVRLAATTVELFAKGVRVAAHPRSFRKGQFTTVPEHMPAGHRAYAAWTPERLVRWATHSGPSVAKMVTAIMQSRAHPQQGFRACLGLLGLEKRFGRDRLEAACARALALGATKLRSVRSILDTELDRQPLPGRDPGSSDQPPGPVTDHPNIRGAEYYQ